MFLSLQEIGVSETHLPFFLRCICDFLSIIMEANCETNEVPVFNQEHTWNKVKGKLLVQFIPLTEILLKNENCFIDHLNRRVKLIYCDHSPSGVHPQSIQIFFYETTSPISTKFHRNVLKVALIKYSM